MSTRGADQNHTCCSLAISWHTAPYTSAHRTKTKAMKLNTIVPAHNAKEKNPNTALGDRRQAEGLLGSLNPFECADASMLYVSLNPRNSKDLPFKIIIIWSKLVS